MEVGFIWPDGSYVQAVGVRDEAHANEILASYPVGTQRVDLKPSADHHWIDGEWVYVEPEPTPPPPTVVYAVDLWTRLTEAEADLVEAAISQQTSRLQNIFRAANSYRSDHELWGMLVQITESLFGETRAEQLLESSE